MRLEHPFLNRGINVTDGNVFNPLYLVKELKKNATTLVGTVSRATREVVKHLKFEMINYMKQNSKA